jgi:hypothetical protein
MGPDMGPHGALIFDLDRIFEGEVSVEDDKLSERVEVLHEDVWRHFVDAKNANYDKLLNGDMADVAA